MNNHVAIPYTRGTTTENYSNEFCGILKNKRDRVKCKVKGCECMQKGYGLYNKHKTEKKAKAQEETKKAGGEKIIAAFRQMPSPVPAHACSQGLI